jgi:DNA (cytosine-5)-methyltransferase 1
MRIEAVDLFCGVGGLTAGLIKSGINVQAGYDIANECHFAYEFNNNASFINKDVAKVTSDEILSWYSSGSIKLLAGCAPCQPFSTYNQGKDTTADKKWPLLYHFSRLIKEVNPELVTMENVPDVIKHKVYEDFISELEALGYVIAAKEVACIDYGVPQTRRRHVLLASKIGKVNLIPPTHTKPVTVREVITQLEPLYAGQKSLKDSLHAASNLSAINLQRIKCSKPGGTWRDWPVELRAECHQKESGKSYPSVYGRMEWDKPAPTMTTLCYGFGNGRFGHPEQDRGISLREAALFQTFPDNYQFIDPQKKISFKGVGRMIGNAVPVRLGEVIGLSFMRHLNTSG